MGSAAFTHSHTDQFDFPEGSISSQFSFLDFLFFFYRAPGLPQKYLAVKQSPQIWPDISEPVTILNIVLNLSLTEFGFDKWCSVHAETHPPFHAPIHSMASHNYSYYLNRSSVVIYRYRLPSSSC